MSKLQNMRVIEIPPFRAVSSGLKTFDDIFSEGGFDSWIGTHGHLIKNLIYAPPDFMWHEDGKSVWIWAVNDNVTEAETAPYNIITFEGGMYLVATADENDRADLNETVDCMVAWINNSAVFESGERPGHRGMCHMPNGNGAIDKAGRIVIPKTIRQIFGWNAGAVLKIETTRDAIVLTPVKERPALVCKNF